MIRLEGVNKTFRSRKGDVRALQEVSFGVEPGEVFGLLGPNGAGKTTALRIIATLLEPDSGVIEVAGTEVRRDPDSVRRNLGFLTGDTKLYDRLTPEETITYFGRLYDMSRERLKQRLEELTELLQMGDYLRRRVGKLSTGQKQKVSIARAVVHDPQVIVLDEPTSGLDVIASRSVVEFIRDSARRGRTVLFSTHIMSEADRICHRIGMIHLGRMLRVESLSAVKERWPEKTLEEIFLQEVGEPQTNDF